MLPDLLIRHPADSAALFLFLASWGLYSLALKGRLGNYPTLTSKMNLHRAAWMNMMAQRELRMIDTSIMIGLQQGTAFFASSCIIAIGGCFALLGSTDTVIVVLQDLPAPDTLATPAFGVKLLGLVVILSYAFFKFGWSYRLFNYCSILIGSVPMPDHEDRKAIQMAANRAARMNILAGEHFNAGLRAIFFSIGYLGWFVGPFAFMATTLFVLAVQLRRQFFSNALDAATEDDKE